MILAKRAQFSGTHLCSIDASRVKIKEIEKRKASKIRKLKHRISFEDISDSLEIPNEEENKQKERRRLTITELWQTETTYVEYLQVAINLFLKPLQQSAKEILSPDKIDLIFQNIEELLEIHVEFLKKRSLRKTQYPTIGDEPWIDLLHEITSQPRFQVAYQKYIHGYDHANELLNQLLKRGDKKSGFGAWVQAQLNSNSSLCRGLASLPAFLIGPVQRLPRYLLLLRDLFKCTPESHPDYPNVRASHECLSAIMSTIDKGKLRYDEMYHLGCLYQKFTVSDRIFVQELTDSNCRLIAEGAILLFDTDLNSYQIRDLIILSDSIICVKKKKSSFNFRWKVDLYNCFLSIVDPDELEGDTSPYFVISEQKKQLEYPFTLENTNFVYTFTDDQSEFNFAYWKKHFSSITSHLLNLNKLLINANSMLSELEGKLVTKREWDLLTVGSTIEQFDKDSQIPIASPLTHFYYISSGKCVIKTANNTVLLSEGDFFGENCYLKIDEKIEGTVICDSDRLTAILGGNNDLAGRFFRLIALTIGKNFIRRAARGQMNEVNEEIEHQLQEKEEEIIEKTINLSTGSQKGNKKGNLAVLHKLKLEDTAPEEEVLQEYTCKLKKTKFSGQFYVLKEYIGFYSQVFGKKKRIIVPSKLVTEVVPRDDLCIYVNHLTQGGEPFELEFKSKENKEAAFSILASLLSEKKRLAATQGMSATRNQARLASGRRGSYFAIDNSHWDSLLANAFEHTVAPGQIILQQGTMTDQLYQIVEGKCKVEMQNEANKESYTAGYCSPGEILGEIPFLFGVVSNATYTAETDVVVVVLPRPSIETLLNDIPEFSSAFYKFLSRTLASRLRNLHLFSNSDSSADPLEEQASTPVPVAPISDKKTLPRTPIPSNPFIPSSPSSSCFSSLSSSQPISLPSNKASSLPVSHSEPQSLSALGASPPTQHITQHHSHTDINRTSSSGAIPPKAPPRSYRSNTVTTRPASDHRMAISEPITQTTNLSLPINLVSNEVPKQKHPNLQSKTPRESTGRQGGSDIRPFITPRESTGRQGGSDIRPFTTPRESTDRQGGSDIRPFTTPRERVNTYTHSNPSPIPPSSPAPPVPPRTRKLSICDDTTIPTDSEGGVRRRSHTINDVPTSNSAGSIHYTAAVNSATKPKEGHPKRSLAVNKSGPNVKFA